MIPKSHYIRMVGDVYTSLEALAERAYGVILPILNGGEYEVTDDDGDCHMRTMSYTNFDYLDTAARNLARDIKKREIKRFTRLPDRSDVLPQHRFERNGICFRVSLQNIPEQCVVFDYCGSK